MQVRNEMNFVAGSSPSVRHVSCAALMLLLLGGCGGGGDGPPPPEQTPSPSAQLVSVSSPSFAVSGGDALVEVASPNVPLASLLIKANGRDVTAAFSADSRTGRIVGFVDGLNTGNNTLTVEGKVSGAVTPASLQLTNNPTTGEIFGAHQRPWVCETQASGLGPPPAQGPCEAPSVISWHYRSTAGQFKPLASLSKPYPADLAQTTTTEGKTVDYIVRVESGVVNESIYRIAIIDDPEQPISNPWSAGGKKPGNGWNGKLSYPFQGGLSAGYRSGRDSVTSALDHEALKNGFAVAYGTRNAYGTGSDDVVSAETVMMVKERFIERYGIPKFTIGNGGSGGAMQQNLIAHGYPGLLDAINPDRSYPDGISVAVDVIDCHLLSNYFNNMAAPGAWPGSRRTTVDGYAVATNGSSTGSTVCQTGWSRIAEALQEAVGIARGFDSVVPTSLRYDPITNPTGARATIWDNNVLSIGKDPLTGFARTLYDNVGVQYGLQALNAGQITKAEFLDLNEKIGGRDKDGNFIAARSNGDVAGIGNAYRYGRVTLGGNLTLPVIQTRNYRDFNNDIHTRERSFATLERLKMFNGTADNMVMWTLPLGGQNVTEPALLALDQWLERIAADRSAKSYAEKVIANKPTTLKSGCWDAAGVRIDEEPTINPAAACNQLFPVHANVRMKAGGPLSGHVMKCQLKPVTSQDYAVTFTGPEIGRLQSIFPQGVCDWTKPGVGQSEAKGESWFTFTAPGVGVSRQALVPR